MKHQKAITVSLSALCLVLLVAVVILFSRVGRLQDATLSQPETGAIQEPEYDFDSLESRVSDLEYTNEMDINQRFILLEGDLARLRDIVLHSNDIRFVHGTIDDLSYEGTLDFTIQSEEFVGDYTVSSDVRVFFVGQFGLSESNVQALVEKETSEHKTGFFDTYTFVIVDGSLIHIYQGIYSA
jgi:hypothetical protein